MSKERVSGDTAWLGLAGRVCVVTGGSSGIGAETARRLAHAGAYVAIVDRDKAGAAAVAAEIESPGGRALAIEADVTDSEGIGVAASEVQRTLGTCDVLVNNAGVQHNDPLMTLSLEKWKRVLDVNLTGAFICAQAFGRQMIAGRRGGSIVNVGSLTGEAPRPDGGAYSASKAGLAMFSRQLAVELGPHRIRSNVVAPGFVRTPLSAKAYRDPEVARARERMVPTGRIGEPQDIAEVILFLSSERSGYVNGQVFVVDGGLGQTLMRTVPRPAK